MRKLTLLILFCIYTFINAAHCQTCPNNLDFENGNFTNWQCFMGFTDVSGGKNQINLSPSAPIPGSHEIISAATPGQMDMFGNFPKLCPYGGKYSVKLGNTGSGAQAEGISYTFTIPATEDTFSFTYFYAVVFEDPGHAQVEQPRFFVTAYDVVTGLLINCASYDYISTGTIPGFRRSTVNSGVLYKSWSPVSIQFAGLANHTVRLEFKTADCTLGGHFGYAYLDVGTGCSNILATAPYCLETNSVILNAPYGFKNYTWYNQDFSVIVGTQQSITLSPPPATSGIFYVDIDPYPGYGCRDTVGAIVTPLPVPALPVAVDLFYCQFQSAPTITATALPGCDLLWYSSSTGGIGSTLPPLVNTSLPGTFYFYVSQKILFGCESLRKKVSVTVTASPVVSFTINNNRQCQNANSFVFTSASTNLQNPIYSWDFGDGQTLATAPVSVSHTYAKSGVFYVKLRVLNPPVCFTEKTISVTVIPKPIADFIFPTQTICQNQTQVFINNNSSTPSGLTTINNWWWSINGAISGLQFPAGFIPNVPGQVPVKLVVTTTEGCRSDTTVKMLPVRYQPTAAYSKSPLLCENETVQFTNSSFLPAAALPETVVKWYWLFDNAINTNTEHQSLYFAAGTHQANLVTETNYGCKSPGLNSTFVIQEKPHLQLSIFDSCVLRTIQYQASDAASNTSRWNWDFGNGFSAAGASVNKYFNTEGNHLLTLIGENIFGCKDTLIRPFVIYDNKAFAGRDTIAAMDEPVQLDAHGDSTAQYLWSPALGLNNADIANPIATLNRDQLYYLDALTDKGCDSHTKILIRRYKGPELYIPTAFTPNGDGNNDLLKVFPVGIRSFDYMAVYNRFGQQLFFTKDQNKGWDGTFKGIKLNGGAFVAIARAIDYKGKVMMQKLSVILIR